MRLPRHLIRMLGAPGDKVTILGNRRVDELIEDVIGGVADEARVEHERVAIRFLQSADMAHGLDPIRARFDQWHWPLLLIAMCVFGRGGSDPRAGGGGRSPLAKWFGCCVLVTLAPRVFEHFLTKSPSEGPERGPA